MNKDNSNYDEASIKSLDWKEHIRLRPGMYIGKLGNGSSFDDGIYILFKEVVDNSIDEYIMGHGKQIDVKMNDECIIIRDYGRGIPLNKVEDCVSKINTGAKYDSNVFKKSVGLNGVGLKAVNALSEKFIIKSIRSEQCIELTYKKGGLINKKNEDVSLVNGTEVTFYPDENIFKNYKFLYQYIENQIQYYVYLNAGLKIKFNNKIYSSKNGLLDLLVKETEKYKIIYPIIHLKSDDIELALTHGNQYGENYITFVNGQNTNQGGTHLTALKEALVKTVRDFYKKEFDPSDIRASIVSALSIRVQNPIFESQTKNKLGSLDMGPEGPTVRIFINDFIKTFLDAYLHKNPSVSEMLLKKILLSEKERKEMVGIKKIATKRTKAANLHNKKLRDCKIHLNNSRFSNEAKNETMIFITEGDSASGSITKTRNVETQAVFSLRGKPLNSYGLSKKIVYENEEFNLLQHALNIENGIDELRYQHIVIATDADVDGMHIRLLLLTFFLQFFPELVRNGHVFILETPLFRVRNNKDTIYAYSEQEKKIAEEKLNSNVEITRFKGLGEISPNEFKHFIGRDIRLEPVVYKETLSVTEILEYYMGKNTLERQKFIINNLRNENTN